MPLRMVKRRDWGARDAVRRRAMRHPVENVVVWYFTHICYCSNDESCKYVMNELQRRDMGQGLSDIRYNFVIGGTGDVYEGRGWFHQPSEHLPYSSVHGSRLDIAYVGNFRGKNVLPYEMLDAKMNLVEFGLKHGYIVEQYYMIEEEQKFI